VKKECLKCRGMVETNPDGSFAMHERPDGGLCSGTNELRLKRATLTIGGVEIEAVPQVELIKDGEIAPRPGVRR
jgi:hypothetical protein